MYPGMDLDSEVCIRNPYDYEMGSSTSPMYFINPDKRRGYSGKCEQELAQCKQALAQFEQTLAQWEYENYRIQCMLAEAERDMARQQIPGLRRFPAPLYNEPQRAALAKFEAATPKPEFEIDISIAGEESDLSSSDPRLRRS